MAPLATAWNRRTRRSLGSERMREGLRHINEALRCFDEGVYTLMKFDASYWKRKAERERRPTVRILLYLLTGECFTSEETGELVNASAIWRQAERHGSKNRGDIPYPAPDELAWFRGYPDDEARLVGEAQKLDVSCFISRTQSGRLVETTTMSSNSLGADVNLNPRLFSVSIRGSSNRDATAVFNTVWQFTTIHTVECFALTSDLAPCYSGPWNTQRANIDPFPLHTYIEAAINCERISLTAKIYSTSYTSNCIMATRLKDVAPIHTVTVNFMLDPSMRFCHASDAIPYAADPYIATSRLMSEGVPILSFSGIQNSMTDLHILNHLDRPGPPDTYVRESWQPPEQKKSQRTEIHINGEWALPRLDRTPAGLGPGRAESTPTWLPSRPSHAVVPCIITPQPHIESSESATSSRVTDLHDETAEAEWYVPATVAQGQSGYTNGVSQECVCLICMGQQALSRPFKSYTLSAHASGGM